MGLEEEKVRKVVGEVAFAMVCTEIGGEEATRVEDKVNWGSLK